jgi:uroporphyrinogen decarboxylase
MISRERVLTVLEGGIPDRIPWIENYISNEAAAGLFGHDNFVHCNYSHKIDRPGMVRIPPELPSIVPLDVISYDMAPPRYAKTELLDGQEHVTEGLIKTKDDLKLLDGLPDPDDETFYRPVEAFLRKYKGDLAAIATVRTGPSNTYLSMGIDLFCRSLITDPELTKEVLWRFSNWTRKVAKNLMELDFDFFFMPDDIGFGAAPMISPEHFREFCVPVMRNVIEIIDRPVVYHSDGNIMPLMDDILDLGVAGIANLEPGPMDIVEVKKLYGDRVTLIGNIDLHYTLTRGTPEETTDEVRERIEALSPGGRYILASANSLPNYVKTENVRAMSDALLRYGNYPPEDVTGRPDRPNYGRFMSPREARASVVAEDRQILRSEAGSYLDQVLQAVLKYQKDLIGEKVLAALDAGIDPEKIINDGLITAMDQVGRDFSENKIFVPEMLMAATTMKEGLNKVKPLLKAGSGKPKGTVMLATVQGDLHDIGKNIVSMMLEGGGFEIVDLGINVNRADIVRKVKEIKPDILGLSALLTTTMPEMKKIIDMFDDENLRAQTKVIIGGAPVNHKFADQIEADGYAPNAAAAVDLCRNLMAKGTGKPT